LNEIEKLTTIDTDNYDFPISSPLEIKRARREIVTPRLSATLDKCKISDRDAVHLLTSCVEAMSLNPLDFVINRTSIRRSRQHFRELNSSNMKLKFFDLN